MIPGAAGALDQADVGAEDHRPGARRGRQLNQADVEHAFDD
jgi:hypothetical protein